MTMNFGEEICVVFMFRILQTVEKISFFSFSERRFVWLKVLTWKNLLFSTFPDCFCSVGKRKITAENEFSMPSEKSSCPFKFQQKFSTLPLHLKKVFLTLSVRNFLWKINKLELVSRFFFHLWFFTKLIFASISWIFHFSLKSHSSMLSIFNVAVRMVNNEMWKIPFQPKNGKLFFFAIVVWSAIKILLGLGGQNPVCNFSSILLWLCNGFCWSFGERS